MTKPKGITFRRDDWSPNVWRWLWSRVPYSLLAGGFGSGKSTAGIAKILLLKSANGRRPGLVIAQSFGALFSNLIDPFLELCDRRLEERLRPVLKGRTGGRPFLLFPDGCKVHLRSAEKVGGYDGLTVAWLYGDECRYWSKRAYEVAIARVRIKDAPWPQRCFTSTPAMHWMDTEYNTGRELREVITCGTAENAANLPDDYIPGLRASYSKRMSRAVLNGEFIPLEGAVYENWDALNPDRFLDYDFTKHRNDHTMIWMDPGYLKSAAVWVRELDPMKYGPMRWCGFRQIMPTNSSMSDVVLRINQWNEANNVEIDSVWIDPAADATDEGTGWDVAEIVDQITMRGRGSVNWITGLYRGLAYGIEKTRVLLGEPEEGRPIRLFFSEDLRDLEKEDPDMFDNRGVIKCLNSYIYPEHKDGRPLGDKPVKDGIVDHGCDAIRYGSVGMWLSTDLRLTDPVLRKAKGAGYRSR